MEHMAYIIREVITEFTNVSFDPRSSKVAAEESFLSIDATRGMRSVKVGLVVPIGNRRYLNGMDPITHPKTWASLEVVSSEALAVINVDFGKLMRRPTDAA